MDVDAARDLIEDMSAAVVLKQQETVRLRARLASLNVEVERMFAVIDSVTALYPDELRGMLAFVERDALAEVLDSITAPRGSEAVRAILMQGPVEGYTVGELVDLMRDRGWLPNSNNPANAVRAAAERLVETAGNGVDKHYEGTNRVVYVFDPANVEEDT